jgi:hypothetical protein
VDDSSPVEKSPCDSQSLANGFQSLNWSGPHNRIFNWNALQLLNGFELALVFLFLVWANELCETTPNDFDLLKP